MPMPVFRSSLSLRRYLGLLLSLNTLHLKDRLARRGYWLDYWKHSHILMIASDGLDDQIHQDEVAIDIPCVNSRDGGRATVDKRQLASPKTIWNLVGFNQWNLRTCKYLVNIAINEKLFAVKAFRCEESILRQSDATEHN